ncbi:MutS-related protein [Macrococcus capreoli]|uniref:MutS-related protein n=2 Tax=Macrococcus capreoli TaxID=2982690 RepID=UPI003EE7B2C5
MVKLYFTESWSHMPLWMTYSMIALGTLILGIALALNDKYRRNKKIKNLWAHQSILNRPKGNHIRYNQYYDYFKEDSAHHIDDVTWNDLDLDRVFHRMNYNFTSVGEEYMYAALRNINNHFANESLMQTISNHKSLREKISFILADLGRSTNNNASRFAFKNKSYKQYNPLMILVSLLPFLSIFSFAFGPSIGIFTVIFAIGVVMSLAMSFKSKAELLYSDLFYAVKIIDTANQLLKLKQSHEAVNLPKIRSIKFLSYLMLSDDNNEMNIALQLINAIKMLFMTDYHIYHYALRILRKNQGSFSEYYQVVGQYDLSYSVAMYRQTLPYYALPETGSLHTEEIYHPLLTQPVANDYTHHKSVLLTGSNASGKSTFMKTIALNIVLAQAINTTTSEVFRYQPGSVLTSMNLEDSLAKGDSYFIAEIKSIKRIIHAIEHYPVTYIFIDEILRGTNTKERISSATAILNHINNNKNTTLFAATHDIELTEILKDTFDFYYFREHLTEDNEIEFDYTIRKGITTTSNAIELMRIHNYPEYIYHDAKQQLAKLKQLNI